MQVHLTMSKRPCSRVIRRGNFRMKWKTEKFRESNGTVLSTNWEEIAKKTTETKPPDCMEFKKYEQWQIPLHFLQSAIILRFGFISFWSIVYSFKLFQTNSFDGAVIKDFRIMKILRHCITISYLKSSTYRQPINLLSLFGLPSSSCCLLHCSSVFFTSFHCFPLFTWKSPIISRWVKYHIWRSVMEWK